MYPRKIGDTKSGTEATRISGLFLCVFLSTFVVLLLYLLTCVLPLIQWLVHLQVASYVVKQKDEDVEVLKVSQERRASLFI